MVLISNKGSFYNLTRCVFYCFIYRNKIHNRVLITKTALTKLLENTLDESLKLKNMFSKRLGCLMKSLLSQNFYRTMSDISKTLISQPAFNVLFKEPIFLFNCILDSFSNPWFLLKLSLFFVEFLMEHGS